MFHALTSLKKLCLVNSSVEVAEPETFRDLDALVELHHSDNQIEALEE
jgi:Leucine-rich repeat (LRR) protein